MTEAIPRQNADRLRLQQIIAGITEGVILLDPDRTIVWANDAALAMHGVADIAALGPDAAGYRARFRLRYRNNHPLASGEYPIDRLAAGETFSDVTVDVFAAGENAPRFVHRVRGLALMDDSNRPDVLALVTTDVTERFNAEERFERTFAANPAPAIICRLSDLRYVKVNAGFLEMTALDRAAVLGRTAYELDLLGQAADRELAVARLHEGRTIPQMETVIRVAGDGTKLVVVAGQPLDLSEDPCMLLTFMDLEPRRRAELELRMSEERFAKSFRLAPIPSFIGRLDGFRILEVNDAFVSVTGYTAEDAVGRTQADLQIWIDAAARRRFEQDVAKTGSARGAELRLRAKAGAVLDCLISADTVTINDERCVLGVIQDITERRRSEADLIVAIESVMQDTTWFSRGVIERLANLRQPRGASRVDAELKDLTARERDILTHVCQGVDDAAIAAALGLSRNTVRNHVATIYRKLDLHTRAAVIVWGRERGVTAPAGRRERR